MKYFLYSFISGVLFGLGNVLIKILVEDNPFFLIILSPLFPLAAAFGFTAFIFNQIALKNVKSSTVTLIITITLTIISIIGGNVLGELMSIYEVFGITLMLISIIIILRQPHKVI